MVWQAEEKAEEGRRHHEYELAFGYDSHLLKPDQIAIHTPGLDAAAVPPTGAIRHSGEGWVDLPRLIQFLADDFVQARWTLVTKAGR